MLFGLLDFMRSDTTACFNKVLIAFGDGNTTKVVEPVTGVCELFSGDSKEDASGQFPDCPGGQQAAARLPY